MNTSQILFLAFLLIFQSVIAEKQNEVASIDSYNFEPNFGPGSYKFSFENSDGTSRTEEAVVKMNKDNQRYLAITGSYTYFDPEGAIHIVEYTADDQGFRTGGKKTQERFLSALVNTIEDTSTKERMLK